ncbi:hypothetical protein EI94DRAFT_1702622 [Lactarius quietus]|nr:hypothetical protein EI94DRAFT_1702622 [Lactarius quietus]
MLAQTPQHKQRVFHSISCYLHRLNCPPLPPPLPVISPHNLDPRSAYRLLGLSPRTTGADDVIDGFVTGSRSAQQLTEPPRTDPDTNPSSPNRYPPLPPTLTTEHENKNRGLYGFDVRGRLRMQYWSSILGILCKIIGAEVIVTAVPSTGSIASSSEQLDRFLQAKSPRCGINFMAHSMGGLDCRHLIMPLNPVEYTLLSLTTIATPHRGSPFMDWCKEYPRTAAERIDFSQDDARPGVSLHKYTGSSSRSTWTSPASESIQIGLRHQKLTVPGLANRHMQDQRYQAKYHGWESCLAGLLSHYKQTAPMTEDSSVCRI